MQPDTLHKYVQTHADWEDEHKMQDSNPSSQNPILPVYRDVLQTTKHRRTVGTITSISLCNAQKEKCVTLHVVLFTKEYATQELKVNKS